MNQAYLKSILFYDPTTGVFTWAKPRQRIQVGSIAGRRDDDYVTITVDGKQYMAHHLAVLYMTGYMPIYPKDVVDHLNTVCDDNRWVNLQLTDHTGNNNNPITKSKLVDSWTRERKEARGSQLRGGHLSSGTRAKISATLLAK
jgi:hypothetical protein